MIQGFVSSVVINAPGGQAINLAVVSRLSWRRAGTRFNTRGVDDEGNAAAFVEVSMNRRVARFEDVELTPLPISFSNRPRPSSQLEMLPCLGSRFEEVYQVSLSASTTSFLSFFVFLPSTRSFLADSSYFSTFSQFSGSNKDYRLSVKRSRSPVRLKRRNQLSTNTSKSSSRSTVQFTPSSQSFLLQIALIFPTLKSLSSLPQSPRSKR